MVWLSLSGSRSSLTIVNQGFVGVTLLLIDLFGALLMMLYSINIYIANFKTWMEKHPWYCNIVMFIRYMP